MVSAGEGALWAFSSLVLLGTIVASMIACSMSAQSQVLFRDGSSETNAFR